MRINVPHTYTTNIKPVKEGKPFQINNLQQFPNIPFPEYHVFDRSLKYEDNLFTKGFR